MAKRYVSWQRNQYYGSIAMAKNRMGELIRENYVTVEQAELAVKIRKDLEKLDALMRKERWCAETEQLVASKRFTREQ